MKKQELIHLHGLLAEVHGHYEMVTDTEIGHTEYNALGVRPTSIHQSKTDHKAAVFALAAGLTSNMDAESEAETKISATAD
jgi:hypothetical protein